jgi:hypothetical protein
MLRSGCLHDFVTRQKTSEVCEASEVYYKPKLNLISLRLCGEYYLPSAAIISSTLVNFTRGLPSG